MNELDVVGVGAAIVDILARVPDKFLTEHDVHKGAMTLVSARQAHKLYGALIHTEKTVRSGGSVANTLAGLALLGADTGFVGKVANDELGDLFCHDLNEQGTAFCGRTEQNGRTAQCIVLVTPDAERTMCTHLGVSGTLHPDDVEDKLCAPAKYLYLEGYLWDTDQNKEAFLRAMTAAKGKVALSLSDEFCVDRHRDSFLKIIRSNIDILFANEAEICSLYQTDNFDTACEKVAQDVDLVALTRGAKGARILDGGGNNVMNIDSHAPTQLVDTTGAGDLFATGFFYGLLQNQPFDVCGRMGCRLATTVIEHMGARLNDDSTKILDLLRTV